MVPDHTTTNMSANSAFGPIRRDPHSAVRNSALFEQARIGQNWVLDRFQDTVLIIAAPLLTLALALLTIYFFGINQGATLVLLVHVVFTVAHHLPTFIRIYGDVELFRRFNWHFIF